MYFTAHRCEPSLGECVIDIWTSAGEYPSNLKEATPHVHISGHIASQDHGKWFSQGDPTGLYHLIVGEGQNAFVGNGRSNIFS